MGDGRKEGQTKIYISEGTKDECLTTGSREGEREREKGGGDTHVLNTEVVHHTRNPTWRLVAGLNRSQDIPPP